MPGAIGTGRRATERYFSETKRSTARRKRRGNFAPSFAKDHTRFATSAVLNSSIFRPTSLKKGQTQAKCNRRPASPHMAQRTQPLPAWSITESVRVSPFTLAQFARAVRAAGRDCMRMRMHTRLQWEEE